MSSGIPDYIQHLKAQGVVHHIGLPSHTPEIVNKLLDTQLTDIIIFSINPSYDYRHGDYVIGSVNKHIVLYRRCEADGVGISVMKAFSGGQLLNAKILPFHQALTAYQCTQYTLDKPGVLKILPSVRGKVDLKQILGFLTATLN